MFRFDFRRKKHKETESERKYVEREVKKIPKVITIIFFVHITIFLASMIWYFYFKSTYYVSEVQGSSMQPILNSGIQNDSQKEDMVYVNRRLKGERGDIVTIQTEGSDKIIKRVIAKEGDCVSIYVADDGFYHVSIKYSWEENAKILNEQYVKSYEEWKNGGNHFAQEERDGVIYARDFYYMFIYNDDENVVNIDGVYYYQIPKNKYFCLGDNRAWSSDSRSRGLFDKSQIQGVAEIIIKGGSLNSGSLASKKFNAIVAFYWKKLENSLKRWKKIKKNV